MERVRWQVVVVFAAALALGGATAGPAAEEATTAVAPADAVLLTGIELSREAAGERLELTATEPLVWTQYRDGDGRLIVELPNTTPAPSLLELGASGDLVASVLVEEVANGERPLTRLTIATAEAAEHELSTAGEILYVSFMRVGNERSPEPVDVATGEVSAPAADQPGEVTFAPFEEEYLDDGAVAAAEPVATRAEPPVAPLGTADEPYFAPQAPGVEATRLETVDVELVDDSAVVAIVGDGSFNYSTFQLADPSRFVIDLHGVVNTAAEGTVPAASVELDRVRIAQFKSDPEPVARVVFDLASAEAVPRVDRTSDGLVVSFGADGPVVADVQPVVEPLADTASAPDAAIAKEPMIEMAWAEPEASPTESGLVQPAPLAEGLAPSLPPAVADQPSDVSLYEAMEVQETMVREQPSGPATPSYESREIGPAETKYVGSPITFSLRDADIKEVLRTFAKISGLNMVVQPGVSGSVTVELEQVPWDQALEQILKINNLGYELEGNIMRVAPLAQLNQEAQDEAARAAQLALAVPLRTVLKRVSYASATSISGLLRSGGGASILSQRGSVVVDARTNTLIIKELPDYMDTVLAVIDQIDVPEPQVMIEARIIETTKRFSRTLGIAWGFDGSMSAATGNDTGLTFPNSVDSNGGVNLLTGGNNGFIDLALGNVLDTFSLDATLLAAESEGLVNILSAPKVATLNNESAQIQSGLQIPIQTVSNNTVTVQFVNATLRLQVTPHVTAEGTVLLDISIQKREPQLAFAVAGASNAPIATKEASTRVIVRDGGTTVIGGIYEVSTDSGQDRVPGLANIPILGHLFKNNRRNNENEELLIFITPRVIKL